MPFKSPRNNAVGWRQRMAGIMGGPSATYTGKVLGYGPIAYWPLYETSGTTAVCLVNALQNGTYSSDVSGWPPGDGIGDGNTAPFFDGANDYVNVFSATLAAAFDGTEGAVALWAKVQNAAVWTDGVRREAIRILDTDTFNHLIWISKATGASSWDFRRAAAGVIESITGASGGPLTWQHLAITWSQTADQVKAYVNGTQFQATSTVLGAWVQAIDLAIIGASDTTPSNQWKGWLQHCCIFDSALAQPAIADLATV